MAWAPTPSEDIGPGDLLPWGVVREKTWGGQVGIEAWRVVVTGEHRPIWLAARRTVICRRAHTPSATSTSVKGVVGSGPVRAGEVRARIRHYLARRASLRRAG